MRELARGVVLIKQSAVTSCNHMWAEAVASAILDLISHLPLSHCIIDYPLFCLSFNYFNVSDSFEVFCPKRVDLSMKYIH